MSQLLSLLSTLGTSVLAGAFSAVLVLKLLEAYGKEFLKARISEVFDEKKFRRQTIGTAELQFRQKQLEELYGPLYTLTEYIDKLGAVSRDVSRDSPATPVFDDLLTDKINRIEWLIENKTHLIEGQSIPDCFADFAVRIKAIAIAHKSDSSVTITAPNNEFATLIRTDTARLKRELNLLYLDSALIKSK